MTKHYYTHVANGQIDDSLSRIGHGGRTCTAAEALGDARIILEEGATSVTVFRDMTPWIRLIDEASKHGEAVKDQGWYERWVQLPTTPDCDDYTP